MKNFICRQLLFLTLAIASTHANGQVIPENSECFNLFTADAEIGFRVSVGIDWISEETVTAAVMPRLREAGLEIGPDSLENLIVVHANHVGEMVILEMELHKRVVDSATGLTKNSRTWAERIFGRIPSEDQTIISGGLAQLAGTFLDEYLQAQQVCARSSENQP